MLLLSGGPSIGQAVWFVHDQHFAVNNSIPPFIRLMAKLKTVSYDGLKIIFRDPLGKLA